MKVKVVLTFEVEHTDECNGDFDEFVQQTDSWAKEDAVGWVLSRPVLERFPTSAQVRATDK